MLARTEWPYYLANEAHAPNHDLTVNDKYSGEVVARVALADAEAIDRAIAGTGAGRSSDVRNGAVRTSNGVAALR